MRQLSKFCVGLAVCAALGGCGDASQPEAKARPPVEHGVFISARDCAATGKLTVDQCGQAIDAAVARHEAEAPAYGSLSQCEATVGADRCDRVSTDAIVSACKPSSWRWLSQRTPSRSTRRLSP